ncbi:hydroxypyruvate isomerase [Escherichia coli]|uniref:Hydroxypyruvate isomerase n=1 Tax=Escherichia coli TaxID=562 RepID=A0A376U3Y0_ECOLX|nr:hydroxypyruvate isomerase [Escherichia coli]
MWFRGVEFMFPYDYDIEELKQVLASNKLGTYAAQLPAGDWAAGGAVLPVFLAVKKSFGMA